MTENTLSQPIPLEAVAKYLLEHQLVGTTGVLNAFVRNFSKTDLERPWPKADKVWQQYQVRDESLAVFAAYSQMDEAPDDLRLRELSWQMLQIISSAILAVAADPEPWLTPDPAEAAASVPDNVERDEAAEAEPEVLTLLEVLEQYDPENIFAANPRDLLEKVWLLSIHKKAEVETIQAQIAQLTDQQLDDLTRFYSWAAAEYVEPEHARALVLSLQGYDNAQIMEALGKGEKNPRNATRYIQQATRSLRHTYVRQAVEDYLTE